MPNPPPFAPSRDLEALAAILRRLRDPVRGCDWHRAQTFATIAPYTIEEAYEVAGAIEDQDWPGLKEELGDLLFQVVYHARMAEELGRFDLGDVVEAITAKMIRRRPDILGDAAVPTTQGMWDAAKAGERALKGEAGTLDGISRALPALTRADKLQKRLSSVGFDWNSPQLVLAKVAEEAAEIVEAASGGASHAELEGEVGDLLFVIANLARHLKVDPEAALRATNSKVGRRFAWIEAELAKDGRGPKDATLAELEALWVKAKAAVGSSVQT
ncbi:MAG TPA: nucleoside triphosphate pyrophosphohydrolase [Rhizomicrobium sp.]|jgi:ATP diphosphatase|nr:nucleoside triphosphate pyrophosphohydrolase [Rhizomicrobium sp.]